MLLSYIYIFRKERVLVCYVNFNFVFVDAKVSADILKMKLYPCLKKRTGLNFIKMWHWINWDRREKIDDTSHIKYSRKNMDMIHCLTYLHFQHELSWNIFFVVSNIVLHFLVSEFLTAILILYFLSLVMVWTNFAQMMMKHKECMFKKEH